MARTSFGECYDNENYSHVLISYDTTPKAWLSNYHAIAYNEFQGLTNVRYFSNGVIIDNIRNLTLIHVQRSRSTTGKTGRRDLHGIFHLKYLIIVARISILLVCLSANTSLRVTYSGVSL